MEPENNLTEEEVIDKQSKTSKKKRKSRWWIIAIIIIILLLLLVKCEGTPSDILQGNIEVPTITDQQAYINAKVEAGMVQVFINTDITIVDGKAALFIQNSEDNKYPFYVELFTEAGNSIYKSDTINPGFKIEYAKIADLSAGEHECYAVFQFIGNNKEKLNTSTCHVTVTI